jgi:hypothetical protein
MQAIDLVRWAMEMTDEAVARLVATCATRR